MFLSLIHEDTTPPTARGRRSNLMVTGDTGSDNNMSPDEAHKPRDQRPALATAIKRQPCRHVGKVEIGK